MKIKNWHKKFTSIIFYITILFILLFIVAFILRFASNNFSTNIVDWGDFGDYFAGTLGVAIALINVLVLYRISVLASEFEKSLLITQLKNSSYIELLKTINSYIFDIKKLFLDKDDINVGHRARELYYIIDSYPIEFSHLIKDIKDSIIHKKFLDSLNKLIEKPKEKEHFEEVLANKAEFISELQKMLGLESTN